MKNNIQSGLAALSTAGTLILNALWSEVFYETCRFVTYWDKATGQVQFSENWLELNNHGFELGLKKMNPGYTLEDYKKYLRSRIVRPIRHRAEKAILYHFPYNNDLKNTIVVFTRKDGSLIMTKHTINNGFVITNIRRDEIESFIIAATDQTSHAIYFLHSQEHLVSS